MIICPWKCCYHWKLINFYNSGLYYFYFSLSVYYSCCNYKHAFCADQLLASWVSINCEQIESFRATKRHWQESCILKKNNSSLLKSIAWKWPYTQKNVSIYSYNVPASLIWLFPPKIGTDFLFLAPALNSLFFSHLLILKALGFFLGNAKACQSERVQTDLHWLDTNP